MHAMQAELQRQAEGQRVARSVVQRLRVSKVEAMQRRMAYQRHEALRKIEAETQRAKQLLEERARLQEQRRMANIEASFQRQQVLEAMAALTRGKADVHSMLKSV